MKQTDYSYTRSLMVFALFLLWSFATANAQQGSLFETGNELYNQGEYQAAIDTYKEILAAGEHSPEVYFNMGNAYYKMDRIAPSILYYEKALFLDPDDEDVKVNLAYARNMTIDDIDALPKTGFAKLTRGLLGAFTYSVWSYLAIVGMLLFVLFFIGYYFADREGRKRLLFAISGGWVFLSLLCLLFAFQQRKWERNYDPAIVFASETTVKSEPNLGSDEIFRLHEGTKVFILDAMHDWKKIRLADGKEGWLPAEELQRIKDF
ncbi:tetratricopeptide repeat protein [Robertkochia sediminum]|uniref:tetratricopeptide repeat protein n=1 Tax=Robertkochia sediminum TaxID=2785326 RepID=UPI0019323415|nr:tetratricopeptide repeat protein [Robertkochia sediminum]MBL7471898.1 tetratricopeptide repeat protein [Robertkochia sediminum]